MGETNKEKAREKGGPVVKTLLKVHLNSMLMWLLQVEAGQRQPLHEFYSTITRVILEVLLGDVSIKDSNKAETLAIREVLRVFSAEFLSVPDFRIELLNMTMGKELGTK